ncbi:hypothetical protein GYMLUDRAFT_41730 [Collybiopsis luxurians FD-317 M1]|uniref:Uncharacterized protein n=1 Tax=Collybiopsis luxurians FD-317 M1 TaxID=944289 RepID=A0A0D0BG23_9AGAR|nr:hypothetical protein GYMLUDRAFT_41730 [Collybiopsis luxurians FD-317 M1]
MRHNDAQVTLISVEVTDNLRKGSRSHIDDGSEFLLRFSQLLLLSSKLFLLSMEFFLFGHGLIYDALDVLDFVLHERKICLVVSKEIFGSIQNSEGGDIWDRAPRIKGDEVAQSFLVFEVHLSECGISLGRLNVIHGQDLVRHSEMYTVDGGLEKTWL